MVIRETIDIHNLINIKIVLLKFLLIERTRVSTIFDLFVTSMRRLIQHRKFRVSPRKYKSKLFADFKLDNTRTAFVRYVLCKLHESKFFLNLVPECWCTV